MNINVALLILNSFSCGFCTLGMILAAADGHAFVALFLAGWVVANGLCVFWRHEAMA